MTPQQKQKYWDDLLSHWEASKVSQKLFCAQNNLNYATFGYWQRKRLIQAQQASTEPACIEITPGWHNSGISTASDQIIQLDSMQLRIGDAQINISGKISLEAINRLATLCVELDSRQSRHLEADHVSA